MSRSIVMLYKILADAIVLAHVGFIVFAVFGGLLVLKWKRLAWLHIPAVIWAVVVEVSNWYCPLTPWEIRLRQLSGASGYETGFVEHYILPILYPAALTKKIELVLGLSVLLINIAVYSWVWRRTHTSDKLSDESDRMNG